MPKICKYKLSTWHLEGDKIIDAEKLKVLKVIPHYGEGSKHLALILEWADLRFRPGDTVLISIVERRDDG